jgi:hypothetical protein
MIEVSYAIAMDQAAFLAVDRFHSWIRSFFGPTIAATAISRK